VFILRQGGFLIASIHTALDDTELRRFQHDLIEQVGRYRARGIIIDVAALDVVDSYGPTFFATSPVSRTCADRSLSLLASTPRSR